MAKGNKGTKVIIVCGPTASGKTGWGVELAKKFNGEIVSADSRQVYRQLNLGTGKEGVQLANSKIKNQKSKLQFKNQNLNKYFEYICWIDDAPQWMINVCDPEERFTLFDWLENAREIIDDILSRGKTPIAVGGTGLYIQALVDGFTIEKDTRYKIPHFAKVTRGGQDTNKSQIPNPKSRNITLQYSREDLDGMGLSELQAIAIKLLANSYQLKALDLNNPRRLIRFIERAQSGEYPTKKKPPYQFLQIAPDFPREELYQRIDKRVDERFKEGMLNEVANLINNGVDVNWLISLGLEYRLMTSYLVKSEIRNPNVETNPKHEYRNPKKLTANSSKLEASGAFLKMKQELKYKIHDFARRQLTWFRRFPKIKWVNNYKEAEKLVGKFLK
jgi:tRNA dimethylallyltransferase